MNKIHAMNLWCQAEARIEELLDRGDWTDEEMRDAYRAFRRAGETYLELDNWTSE